MKIQSPWMGRVRGSAGNMTGCKVYDKNVMRAKAFEVSNPNTAAQQNQRTFFAELTALCSDFDEALLRTLFPQKPKSMSRRNAITKQIALSNTIVDGAKVIDYSDIDTLGNAPVMDFGTTTVEMTSSEIQVILDDSVRSNTTLQPFFFFIVLVNEKKKQISIQNLFEQVEIGSISLDLISSWASTDTIHAIPLITDAKTYQNGFGTVSVIKRPAKKIN